MQFSALACRYAASAFSVTPVYQKCCSPIVRMAQRAHHECQEEGPPCGLACMQQGCQTRAMMSQRHGTLLSLARCQAGQMKVPCRLSPLLWLCLASWHICWRLCSCACSPWLGHSCCSSCDWPRGSCCPSSHRLTSCMLRRGHSDCCWQLRSRWVDPLGSGSPQYGSRCSLSFLCL